MCRQAFDLYEDFVLHNLIYDAILQAETNYDMESCEVPAKFCGSLIAVQLGRRPSNFPGFQALAAAWP